MQAPMTVGSILQDRYRIIQILGQGEFGRTYLAEDQRRFNEFCAIKELISPTEADAWEKAQALFQGEAAILYQIEHSQVPKFREKFAQSQRLFLVEDYVAGKTYRSLLSERLEAGKTFAEAEVLQLIGSLLLVLEHIHSRGIIHGDISPENIILRDRDSQ
ncbi:protein kinase domain-containing protein, partial [Nodularia sphaerocarpa]